MLCACGAPLPPKKPGPPRKWCDECNKRLKVESTRAWEARGRKPLRTPNGPHSKLTYKVCGDCGVAIAVYLKGSAPTGWAYCPIHRAARRSAVNRRKSAKRRGARIGPSFTTRQIAERDGWRCHLCRRRVPDRRYAARPMDATVDHLVPISAGGPDTPENVALAHLVCNQRRSTRGKAQLRLLS